MEQSNRILNLISEGVGPSKIAAAISTSIGLVTQELTRAIHERRVRRSQVLATLDKKWLDELVGWAPSCERTPRKLPAEFIHRMLKESNTDEFDLGVEEVKLYLLCLEKAFKAGDIYEALCEIERTLHTKTRIILVAEYGPKETGWWRQGVPQKVRLECVKLREADVEFADDPAYSYTTLINLVEIIEHKENRVIFERRLPLDASGKKPKISAVASQLVVLSKIRNKVMHPVKSAPPTEEDFFFVKQTQAQFDITKWR